MALSEAADRGAVALRVQKEVRVTAVSVFSVRESLKFKVTVQSYSQSMNHFKKLTKDAAADKLTGVKASAWPACTGRETKQY